MAREGDNESGLNSQPQAAAEQSRKQQPQAETEGAKRDSTAAVAASIASIAY
jgi:hypothetical protein